MIAVYVGTYIWVHLCRWLPTQTCMTTFVIKYVRT
jgi:hypothetical protein